MEAESEDDSSNQNEKANGRGDTIKWILSKVGLTEKTTKAISGEEDCGCDERRSFLNRIFPYKKGKDKDK